MKFNWKRAVEIFLFVLIFRIVFELGFFIGERKSPAAYDRQQLDLVERAYIDCREILENG